MTASADLHPSLTPLAPLLGTWAGEGEGHYPTIAAFRYREQVSFTHVGKPFLVYAQRTAHPDSGAPMHAEVGYLRIVADVDPTSVAVEFVLAHPTGIVEVEEGRFADGVIELRTTTVGRTATAKQVRSLRRRFVLDADVLAYDVWMAHADTPETHHLQARLHRRAAADA
ncbi:FABP family protein [Egicoccus sp. AB-alg6-2]|uniref:FABP family protein n=1 Tax=Egicoccus sp. AB-alg6-2 TaxID=3242692 RepID=UPI00359E4FE0